MNEKGNEEERSEESGDRGIRERRGVEGEGNEKGRRISERKNSKKDFR